MTGALSPSRRAALAVAWGLGAKLLLALFFISMPGALDRTAPLPGFVGKVQSESLLHLRDAEALLGDGILPADVRSPGYALALLPLRAALSRANAANALVLVQVLLAGLAIAALAALATEAFGPRSLTPVITLVAFGLSTYTTAWDVFLLPASLATSALVFAVLMLARGFLKRSALHFLAAGALFAWAGFLVPATRGAFVLGLLTVLGASMRSPESVRAALRNGVLLALPAVVAAGAWTALEHASSARRPAPVAVVAGLETALEDFLRAWGGSVVHWDPRAEINWFEIRTPRFFELPKAPVAPPFPGYVYTSAFGPADLVSVKGEIRESRDPLRPLAARQRSEQEARGRLERYRASIRDERPFVYYVVAPLRLLAKFLVHSGTYNLFSRPAGELRAPELLFKASMTVLYAWVLIMGAAGLVMGAVAEGRRALETGLTAITVYLSLVYPVCFRSDEARHFVPAYPFMLLFASYGTARLLAGLREAGARRGARRG